MGRRTIIGAAAPARDAEQIATEVAALRALPLAELRARWRALGGGALPKTLPAFLVLRLVAYKLQAQRFGDLKPELRKALLRRGGGEAIVLPVADADRSAPGTLVAGTLLTREWAGHVQHVMVLADGFAWNGQMFGSLSEVARAITGTRWSGPTFFGLQVKMRSGKSRTEVLSTQASGLRVGKNSQAGAGAKAGEEPGAGLVVGGVR